MPHFVDDLLLPLCSVKRVSEIHALSRQPGLSTTREDGTWVIHCNPGFLALILRPERETATFDRAALARHEGQSEKVHCPVRAVKAYPNRTKDVQSDRLLVRWASLRSEFFPQTVSSWIRRTIKADEFTQNLYLL